MYIPAEITVIIVILLCLKIYYTPVIYKNNSGRNFRMFVKFENSSISPQNIVSPPSDWAIIVYGGIRTYEYTRNSIITKLKNAADPPMDLISYTFFNNSSITERRAFDLLHSDSAFISKRDFVQQTSTKTHRLQTIDRYNDQYTLIKMLLGVEYQKKHTYKYIIFLRPDLYFSEILNITNIKNVLEKKPHLLLNPTCCRFGGYCDRFSIAKRNDMVKMLEDEQWYKSISTIPMYEGSFKARALHSNLTEVDNNTTGYSFSTLRQRELQSLCNNTIHKVGWTDYICFKPWASERPRKIAKDFFIKDKNQICKYTK